MKTHQIMASRTPGRPTCRREKEAARLGCDLLWSSTANESRATALLAGLGALDALHTYPAAGGERVAGGRLQRQRHLQSLAPVRLSGALRARRKAWTGRVDERPRVRLAEEGPLKTVESERREASLIACIGVVGPCEI
jgi:hypothetical protein